ncbi:MAG: OmpA family protein [Terriglobales bacterium]
MSRRKHRTTHVNHEGWLVSYADFITLLFAFFVVLYASSQVDKRKVGKLAFAIQVAFQEMGVFQASTTEVPIDLAEPMPFSTAQEIENTKRSASLGRIASRPDGSLGTGSENGDLAALQAELETALAAEIKRKEIALRREPDGLVISLREVGFFESGSAQMKSSSADAFDRIANMLRQRDYRLRIEGHTDNTPIHNTQYPSNWELSTARATEIVRLLVVRDGFTPNRLSAAGYAEYHPVATNVTSEGRGMNRRVDIVILGHSLPELPATQPGNQTTTPAATTNKPPRAPSETKKDPSPASPKPALVNATTKHLQQ